MEQSQEPTLSSQEQHELTNVDLEIALVRIARTLYEYVESQDDAAQLRRLDPIFDAFHGLANDYHNHTGMLHPDLALELSGWTGHKEILLTVSQEQQAENERKGSGTSGITPEHVAAYGEDVLALIEDLERQLGLGIQDK